MFAIDTLNYENDENWSPVNKVLNRMWMHGSRSQEIYFNLFFKEKRYDGLQSYPSTNYNMNKINRLQDHICCQVNKTRSEYYENKESIVELIFFFFSGEWNHIALSAADIIKKSHTSF